MSPIPRQETQPKGNYTTYSGERAFTTCRAGSSTAGRSLNGAMRPRPRHGRMGVGGHGGNSRAADELGDAARPGREGSCRRSAHERPSPFHQGNGGRASFLPRRRSGGTRARAPPYNQPFWRNCSPSSTNCSPTSLTRSSTARAGKNIPGPSRARDRSALPRLGRYPAILPIGSLGT